MADRRPQETERTGGAYKPGAALVIPEGASYRNRHGTATPASGTWTGAAPTAAGVPGRGAPSPPPGMPTGNPNAMPGSSPYSFGGGGLGGRGNMGGGDISGPGIGAGAYGKPPSFGGRPNTLGYTGTGQPAGMGQPASGADGATGTGGTESGNTYLEDRYLNRLFGDDPAFNYAAKRGMEEIGTRFGAAGLGNSGAARQQESDFYANLVAQSQGQLDQLAAGASGARQNKLNAMFGQGLGLAGGQAGLASAYDLGAAGNMDAANRAQMQLFLNKAGVDTQAAQGGLNNLISMYTAYNSGGNSG